MLRFREYLVHQVGWSIARKCLYGVLMIAIFAAGWFVVPGSVHYHLIEHYVFSASQQNATIYLAVIVPKNGAYQTVQNMQVIWDGIQEQVSSPAIDTWKFQGAIPAHETREAVISYDVILNQGTARWTAPVMDFQLHPQTDIESNQLQLVQQAAEIAQGQTRTDAYALYAYVSAYLSWPQSTRIGENQSALTAYMTRVGGCGEFANLAIALCRAAKIPAQAITGIALPGYPPFWSDTKVWGHPGGAHAWAEVYTDSHWELVDPSWGSRLPDSLKWIWFGRNDGSHLSYGEMGQYAQNYDALMAWGKQSGVLIGAMSQPIHFVAAADSDGVSIVPSVTLRKGWDGRWGITVGLYVLGIILMWAVERRFKQRNVA